MPREIIWLPDAVLDLVRLRDFIREKIPQLLFGLQAESKKLCKFRLRILEWETSR